MRDGLATGEIRVGSVVAGVGSITGLLESSESIAATELEANSVTASEIAANAVGASEQAFVGHGSPTTFAVIVQSGSGIMPAATSAWCVFGTKFATGPFLIANGPLGGFTYSDISAGSFLGSGAQNITYNWIAVG